MKIVFKFLIFLLIFSSYSCENKEKRIKKFIENAYEKSSLRDNKKVEIENLKILEIKTVDFDFFQNLRINGFLEIIQNTRKIIELNKKNIKLVKRKIELYNKLNGNSKKPNEKYELSIKKEKNNLKEYENNIKENENIIAIKSQEIVLMKAETIENNVKDEYILYIFNGKINNESRIDTMGILRKMNTDRFTFVKNGRFADYDVK